MGKRLEINDASKHENFKSPVVEVGSTRMFHLEKVSVKTIRKNTTTSSWDWSVEAIRNYFREIHKRESRILILDDDKRLSNMFWVDTCVIAAYQSFGDVITLTQHNWQTL